MKNVKLLLKLHHLKGLFKRRMPIDAFSNSSDVSPQICILHSPTNNSKINGLCERCLRVNYHVKRLISIYIMNPQSLAIEIFSVRRTVCPHDISQHTENFWYNLRQISEFSRLLVKSVYCGTKSVSFPGPKIRDMLSNDYRDLGSSNKVKIKFSPSWRSHETSLIVVNCI